MTGFSPVTLGSGSNTGDGEGLRFGGVKLNAMLQELFGKTLDQWAAPAADVGLNAKRITNLADPASAQDAATKAYVDALVQGLDPKASVRCATTANITLSGEQTIDGIATSSSRVLVKNQNTASQNGIYVSASGSWTRATDADAWTELPGAYCFVEQGSTQADTGWLCTVDAGGTIGSTSVTWVQFTSAGGFPSGAWTSFTPTISSGSGTFTTVSATGRYLQAGKTVLLSIQVDITNKGTATDVRASLPVSVRTGSPAQNLSGREGAVNGKGLNCPINPTSGFVSFKYPDNTEALDNGASLSISGQYEAA